MGKLIFTLTLALTAWLISLLTGRGRRQIERIPEGMGILCQPPGKRYVLYAMGVVVFVFVMLFSVLYIMDGAPENARFMWGLCLAAAVLLLTVCILGGNMMARDCVYFNGEKIQIEKAFRKPRVFHWNEIQNIKGNFDQIIHLYLADGTKVLTADVGMVNYEIFCAMLKKKCAGNVDGYYRSQTYEHPQKCILRCGTEYYMLAVMGILIFLVYLALFLSADKSELLEVLRQQRSPSEWFTVWFAPICGVVSIGFLFLFSQTNIRYSPEKVVVKFPLRRKRTVYWKEISKIEMVPSKRRDGRAWKTLRIYTQEHVYRFNLEYLTHGQDGFLTELFKMAEKYEIPCLKKD